MHAAVPCDVDEADQFVGGVGTHIAQTPLQHGSIVTRLVQSRPGIGEQGAQLLVRDPGTDSVPDLNCWRPLPQGLTAEAGRGTRAHARPDLPGMIRLTPLLSNAWNRRCSMMEIDALYCDVTVRRREEFTGQKAERFSKGVDAA